MLFSPGNMMFDYLRCSFYLYRTLFLDFFKKYFPISLYFALISAKNNHKARRSTAKPIKRQAFGPFHLIKQSASRLFGSVRYHISFPGDCLYVLKVRGCVFQDPTYFSLRRAVQISGIVISPAPTIFPAAIIIGTRSILYCSTSAG